MVLVRQVISAGRRDIPATSTAAAGHRDARHKSVPVIGRWCYHIKRSKGELIMRRALLPKKRE